MLYGGEYPFVQTADIKAASFYLISHEQTYNEVGLAQSRLWPRDTLCITIAANIAETALLAYEACFPDSIIGFIADPQKCDVRFVKYYFETVKTRYKQVAQGAAQDNLSQGKLLSFLVPNPPLTTQQRTADILSAYDNLIENNRRRMALLEEAMYLLYSEWFVHLRFPGHEQISVIDGVPTGWRLLPIGELLEFHIGGGWGQEEFDSEYSEPAYVLRGTDLESVRSGNLSNVPFRYHTVSNISTRLLLDNDIVFEVSGGSKTQGVGRALLISDQLLSQFNQQVICASFCKLLRPRESSLANFLYLCLNYWRVTQQLIKYESQSASNIINFRFSYFLENAMIFLPPESLLREFNGYIEPISAQNTGLAMQVRLAEEARDLLLPRLMNGSIPV